jgi:hypothetical protein
MEIKNLQKQRKFWPAEMEDYFWQGKENMEIR